MKRRIIAFVTVTLLVFTFAIPTLASADPEPPPTGDTQSTLTPGQIVTISNRNGMAMNVTVDGTSYAFTLHPASPADVNSAQYTLFHLVRANPQMQGSQ